MYRRIEKRDSMCDIEYGSIQINYEPSTINFFGYLFKKRQPKYSNKIYYYFDLDNKIYNNNHILNYDDINVLKNKKIIPIAIRNKSRCSIHYKNYFNNENNVHFNNFKIFHDHPSFPIIKKSEFNCSYGIANYNFEFNINYTFGLCNIYKDINQERYIFAYNPNEFTKSQVLYLLDNILMEK